MEPFNTEKRLRLGGPFGCFFQVRLHGMPVMHINCEAQALTIIPNFPNFSLHSTY